MNKRNRQFKAGTVISLMAFLCVFLPAVGMCGTGDASSSAIESLSPRIGIRDLMRQETMIRLFDDRANSPSYAQSDLDFSDPVDVYAAEKKSPGRAFLRSFLIPGWGQLYTGSKLKAALFLGVEAAGWYSISNFNSNGNEKEGDYEEFADSSWNGDRYLRGLNEVFYNGNEDDNNLYMDTLTYNFPDEDNPAILIELTFSHHAFYKPGGDPVPTSEYYENIGKYHQFNFGWDDYSSIGDSAFPTGPTDFANIERVSEKRQTYLQMRDDANKEFKRASTILIAVIGNHLIAGVEAALAARRFNRATDQFGRIESKIRLARSPSSGKIYPKVMISYKF